jgi:hypothetical protein
MEDIRPPKTTDIVEFETAKLAKIKGFDYYTARCYNDNQELSDEEGPGMNFNRFPTDPKSHMNMYSAPKQEEIQRWLRDKHQIFVIVDVDCTCEPKFAVDINQFFGNPRDLAEKEWRWNMHCAKESGQYLYRTYEDALEEALIEALGLINE